MKIYVDSEEIKQELLKESEYIHDFIEIVKKKNEKGILETQIIGLDSDKAGTLMHIYMNPDIIVVSPNY